VILLATYHEITENDSRYVYSISTSRFVEHTQVLAHLSVTTGSTALSFDDGHISNYELALPILETHNCRAIHFLSASWIGRRDNFMDWNQVRELHKAGHEMQSHSWSHPFLTECKDEDLELELTRSKEVIEDRLGVEVTAISMPGGRWDRRVVRACAMAGYQRIYLSDPFFRPRIVDNVEILGRLMVSRSMSAHALHRWVSGNNRQFGIEWMRRRSKDLARNVLGNSMYHLLWRTLGGAERSLQGRG